ncbi:DUF2017 family protein [Microbacterium gilvum]|uniref:DUF2017 domain-containing protein n=1 Tax=Microbacterium gilvum TaxID=1336204 RepID=A0ABP8ZV00_9MICO
MPDVVVELSAFERGHLRELVAQFAGLVAGRGDDPALERLTPSAYRDDAGAAAEFRGLTRDDLLSRRADDAAVVLAGIDRGTQLELDAEETSAWLRTLAAVRLVLATRLGIDRTDDLVDRDEPRFALYDWLGYRLELLVRAADGRDR